MQNMSHEERVEFIAEVVAEIALTKSSTKFWLAATGKALNAAGKGVRKIAQVVEAEAASKPKAVAATPEGIMLDAAEVLETEVTPITEVAKLQEGPAVEGRAAAQGVQAAEDAEAAAKAKPIIEEAHPGEPVQERIPVVEERPQPAAEPGQVHEVPAVEAQDNLWDMPIGGKKINGRRYTTHALERMAPDTPQVRAELEARAIRKGFSKSSKEFEKYVQPRNIPPCVVENVIQCGACDANGIRGTLTYILDGVKVVTNIAGDVITVHVC